MKRKFLGVVGAVIFALWSAQASAAVTVTIGDATGFPGSDTDVTVGLSGAQVDVASVQLDILFSPTVLDLSAAVDCTLADRLVEDLVLFVFQPEPGRARFLVIDLQYPGTLIGNGELFTCTFDIAAGAPGGVTELIGDRMQLADELGMPIVSSVENGEVTVLLCGNGSLDDGEECDDGSDNGTSRSCCTAECEFVPDGEASCDGNDCTRPDNCTAGVCTPGSCADGAACTICGGVCVDGGSSCSCQ